MQQSAQYPSKNRPPALTYRPCLPKEDRISHHRQARFVHPIEMTWKQYSHLPKDKFQKRFLYNNPNRVPMLNAKYMALPIHLNFPKLSLNDFLILHRANQLSAGFLLLPTDTVPVCNLKDAKDFYLNDVGNLHKDNFAFLYNNPPMPLCISVF